ncbi:MAG: DNA recombination protein RmuC [Qingshengfaniella sp.]
MGAALVVFLLLVLIWRAAGRSARMAAPISAHLDQVGQRLNDMADGQTRLAGGLSQVTQAQTAMQAQILTAVERRLEEVTRTMGDSLHGASTRTARSLGELQTRLETIDKAQANIEKLSGDVLGLQDILSNKQTRGAFGEIQLADIVRKALPADAYGFQVTLSNGKRADCVIEMPNPPGRIVIDSKFPLEPYEALVRASTDQERTTASRAMRNAVRTHIRAIAERYILKGETADSALMFVPSEAVFAELHARFGDIVREGFAQRVWLVSPTTCMATLNTLRSVLKDVRMREQAGLIRKELAALHQDVRRLSERSEKLDRHFAQARTDLTELMTSTGKIATRAGRLESFDFEAGTQRPHAAE